MNVDEFIRKVEGTEDHDIFTPRVFYRLDGEMFAQMCELLKEPGEQKRKWLQNIADNQLSIGGADPLTEYEQGKWDGLQMAFEILTEER